MERRRVLIIAPYFPPRRRVGGLRPFRFASHLRAEGWEPRIVCLATPGEQLTQVERARLDGIEVIELGTPMDATRRNASGGLSTKVPASSGSRRSVAASPSVFARALQATLQGIDAATPIDTWAPLLMFHALRLLPQLRAWQPHAVFSTADPWSSHLLADIVTSSLQVPWVADFRDPWTLCSFRGAGPSLTRRANRTFERRVLRRAARITFTAEQTLDSYAAAYPEAAHKLVCIRNGFDGAHFLDEPGSPPKAPEPSPQLRLCFFGRFRPLSPARGIAAALAELPVASAKAIRIVSAGALGAEDQQFAERAGVASCFESMPPVPYEQALGRIRQYDLSLLSAAAERADIIPAKLWDYLAAGRPILALSSNPEVAQILASMAQPESTSDSAVVARASLEDAGARLAQAGAGVQFHPDQSRQIAGVLQRCLDAKTAGQPLPIPAGSAPERLRLFDAPALTAQLARVLSEIV